MARLTNAHSWRLDGLIDQLTNSQGIDILAADAKRSVRIQVKANQGSKRDWMLDPKVETSDGSLYFVFVNLNGLDQPSFFVVPGDKVITECKRQTQGLANRNMDNPIRHFRDPSGEYLGKWGLLGLESAVAGVTSA